MLLSIVGVSKIIIEKFMAQNAIVYSLRTINSFCGIIFISLHFIKITLFMDLIHDGLCERIVPSFCQFQQKIFRIFLWFHWIFYEQCLHCASFLFFHHQQSITFNFLSQYFIITSFARFSSAALTFVSPKNWVTLLVLEMSLESWFFCYLMLLSRFA